MQSWEVRKKVVHLELKVERHKTKVLKIIVEHEA